MSVDGALGDWIVALQDRRARGDLENLEPVELGYGTARLPVEDLVRILLAELRDLDDLAGTWGDVHRRDEQRRLLLRDFRRLRELIG